MHTVRTEVRVELLSFCRIPAGVPKVALAIYLAFGVHI